jgi:hypothetical protein
MEHSMEIRKTTLRQWWEAGDGEQSAVKRAAFKCWAVAKGFVSVASGLGAAYHLYDWWRCRDEGNKSLGSFHPHLSDAEALCRAGPVQAARAQFEAEAAEELRRSESAIKAYDASLGPVLQHLRAADDVFDEMEAASLKNLAHRGDDLRMDAELEDFFARSDALLAQTKALQEAVQPLTDQKKDA